MSSKYYRLQNKFGKKKRIKIKKKKKKLLVTMENELQLGKLGVGARSHNTALTSQLGISEFSTQPEINSELKQSFVCVTVCLLLALRPTSVDRIIQKVQKIILIDVPYIRCIIRWYSVCQIKGCGLIW